jgi:hypothetical protein
MLAMSLSSGERSSPDFRSVSSAPRVQVHGQHRPGRLAVEAPIRSVHRQRHRANVQGFASVLVSHHDEHSELVAAARYRAACPNFAPNCAKGTD